MTTRRALQIVLAMVFFPPEATAQTAATSYLQSASDRYQSTVDVYTVADGAGNHFAARGEIDSNNGLGVQVPAMDEISSTAPCLNITCITATYDPSTNLWGGWYFLNGILGATDATPSSNWGTVPNAGYDLAGATTLQFWARGQVGGEQIHFFAFGVGNTNSPFQQYPDSATKATTTPVVTTLTTNWTQYQIPLAGLNLDYVLGGFGWVGVAAEQMNPGVQTFYLDSIEFVKSRPTDARLMVSYETVKSMNTFDSVMRNAAFTYDNAVALIGLAAAGDTARAEYTANALIYGQQNDRFFTDNRVRNAYQGGDISLPPGWVPNNKANTARMPGWYDPNHTTWYEDVTQVSSNTGNIAWTMIANLYLYDLTRQSQYLTSAQQLGAWVIANTSAATGPGFTGGYDGWENGAASSSSFTCASNDIVNGQCKRHYKATEHNIDLYSAFSHLYVLDGSAQWAAAAQQAKAFFLSMWDPIQGKFWTGTLEDEVTTSTDVIPLDIQVWSLEALGSEDISFLGSLAFIEANHKTANGYGFKQDGGNSCGDNAWFEGTSQVALAYKLNGNPAKANSILAAVHLNQNSTGSMPATDGSCLNTGFYLDDGSPWLYFPRAHVGATGWLSIAESGTNPFRSDLYSPSVSPVEITFPAQNTMTTSTAAAVTVTNLGTAAFVIGPPSISGANPGDFNVLNNGCASGVAIGASCTVMIVFAPQGPGSRAATLTLTEQASGSIPALQLPSVQLMGTGITVAQYTLALAAVPANGGTVTATPASTNGTYSAGTKVCLNVTPAAGFAFSGWNGDTLDAANCIVMAANHSITAAFSAEPHIALLFVPVAPCRVVDTRTGTGPFGGPELSGESSREFDIPNSACNIPSSAAAYSLNVTVVPDAGLSYLTIWSSGQMQPVVSTLNSDGRVKAAAAIVPAGTNGGVNVYVTDPTQLILDINGYFVPATQAGGLDYYPVTPCRIADTRNANGALGGPYLPGGTSRNFPVTSSNCGIPAGAQAYSLNMTSIPHSWLAYLTVWPQGQTQPVVSTLNSPGVITANAAIVPAGSNGGISVYVSNDIDLAIDVDGYFAAPAAGGLSFYPVTPCRVLDTRSGAGQPFNGSINANVSGSSCNVPTAGGAYVLNATAVPPGLLWYLTLWPNGAVMPVVSTLNSDDGRITSNMAIVPTTNGTMNAFGTNATHLILDISGYFAP